MTKSTVAYSEAEPQKKDAPSFASIEELFKVIRLRGYNQSQNPPIQDSEGNDDPVERYKRAKAAVDKGYISEPGLSATQQERWLAQDGGLGLMVPKDILVLDIDNPVIGECVHRFLTACNLTVPTICTPNGWQFFFANSEQLHQTHNRICPAGFKVDTRTQAVSNGYIVMPSKNTPGRKWIIKPTREQIVHPIENLPELLPVFRPLDIKTKDEGLTELITKDHRHDTLRDWAVRLYGLQKDGWRELTDEVIKDAVYFINLFLCNPPKQDREEIDKLLKAARNYIYSKPDEASSQESPTGRTKMQESTIADRLLDYALHNLSDRFMDQFGVPHCKTTDGRIISLNSSAADYWLTGLHFNLHSKTVDSQAIKRVRSTLAGITMCDDVRKEMHVRSAQSNGAVYVELRPGNVVEITGLGWRIINDPPVMFRQYPNLKPLPRPAEGVDYKILAQLLGLFPCRNLSDTRQLLACIVTALLSEISRPILLFTGEPGAGKTTLQKLIKRLLDPGEPESFRFGDMRDAMQKGMHCQIGVMDNLSAMTVDQIDMACRWVTGDADSKRKNYTDDEDVVYKFKRQLLMNGTNRPASRADFLDRCLPVEMKTIPKSERMTEKELCKLLEEHHSEWLGAIFTLLSKALAIKPTLKLKERERLADWDEYAHAIFKVLGKEEAYADDRRIINERQQQAVFDASPVAQAIVSFMSSKEDLWKGTAAKLLEELRKEAAKLSLNYSKDWPKTPNNLTSNFPHLVSTLASHGVRLKYGEEMRDKYGRWIILTKN